VVNEPSFGGATDRGLRIIDAESGGDISRVIIGGAPNLEGESVAAQCRFFAEHHDELRLKLIRPPHGELHMCPVLLLPPKHPDADFGVIIMESMGYPPISGSNLFCATRVALEYTFIDMNVPRTNLLIETPGGLVKVIAQCEKGSCGTIEFENAPARVLEIVTRELGPGRKVIEINRVSAGVEYAVVDADRPQHVELTSENTASLIDLGRRIASALGTDFVLFFSNFNYREAESSVTLAVFQAPGLICRSPTGTGTSAMLALAYANGWIDRCRYLTARSIGGTLFRGKIAAVREESSGRSVTTTISGESNILGPVSIH
jgi:proline racemase